LQQNATAIGASANVVVIGVAKRSGHLISFWEFTRYGQSSPPSPFSGNAVPAAALLMAIRPRFHEAGSNLSCQLRLAIAFS
jgi:Na+/H+ antiporter NhaD/arsenite permease-like protein